MAWSSIIKDNKPTAYNVNGVRGKKWVCRSNEEWRQERCHSIGASSVGILIGENPFTTPMELAHKMRAELRGEFDYTQNMAMRIGHAFEGGVAQLFSEESGREVIQSSRAEYLLRRDDLPFMHVSPDRTYWIDESISKHGEKGNLNKGILECKTTSMPVDADNLPASWIFQLQDQMGVSGLRHGAIAWFVFPTRTFGYREFDYDEEIFAAVVEVCRDFWERCIEGGEEPEPVNVRDLATLYPRHTVGKTITVNQKAMESIAELKDLQATSKELEKVIEEHKDALKMQFTDEEAMVDMDGRVLCTYKTNAKGQRTLLIK